MRPLVLTLPIAIAASSLAFAAAEGTSSALVPLHRYSYQSWSAESGLPNNDVSAAVRDADGYVWVGTANGLARFDGAVFDVFRSSNTDALRSSRITSLLRDERGRIWIATARNLAVYEHGVFAHVAGSEEVGKIAALALAPAPSGGVLVGADVLLHAASPEGLEPEPSWTQAVAALLSEGSVLWVGGDGGVARFEGGVREECRLPASASGQGIVALARANEDLWVATERGLFAGPCGGLKPVTRGEPKEIHALASDSHGVVWVSAGGELVRWERRSGLALYDAAAPPHFPDVTSIAADEGGTMWLGSGVAGLRYIWRSRVDQFGPEEGLVDVAVWTLESYGDGLAVGSNGGLDLFRDGRFERLVPHADLPNPTVYSLLRDAAGGLWVGLRGGLLRLDENLEVDDSLQFEELKGLQINGLLELGDGIFLVGSSGGLFRVDVAENRLEVLGADSDLGDGRVRYVLRDRRGAIWVGTEEGLFVDREGTLAEFDDAGLGLVYITAILELEDGRLLVGSWNTGLFLEERAATGSFRPLGPEQGLPSSNIFSLSQHGASIVVSHLDGVYRFPRAALEAERIPVDVLHLDTGDRPGRSRIRCCNGAGHGRGILDGDTLWVPSLYGVVSVDLEGPPEPPPVARVTRVVQGKRVLPLPSRAASSPVRLDDGSRDVQIQYGAVDLEQARPLEFRYRLAEFDSDWVEVETRRLAIYTRLAPGVFRFEVEARRPDGPWGPAASFELDVPKHLMETWPMRLLLVSLVGPVIFGLVRFRVARLQAQRDALEAVVQERTLELKEANRRLEAMNQALAEASVTDPLTGLHNRRFLKEHAPGTLARLARARAASRADLVIGVLLVDIDHFKEVNDNYGHAVGDEVLKCLAESLKENLREGDVLVRWGGEEFLVVAADIERSQLEATAERVRTAISGPRRFEGVDEPIQVTASIGFATFPVAGIAEDEQCFETTLELADHALYAAKASGRDRSATVQLAHIDPESWPGPGRVRGADLEAWCAENKAKVVVTTGD